CIGLVSVCTLFAKWQDLSHEMNIEGVLTKAYHPIAAGTPVVLEKVIKLNTKTETLPEINMVLRIDGSPIPVPLSQARYIEFSPKNAEEYWQCAYLKNDMYTYYRSKGYNRGYARS
ncbi:MAG: hypothetical protein LUE93_13520, partial [Bacteroides sp.]|nr:hypothetical protein [Bacteroides sp.]